MDRRAFLAASSAAALPLRAQTPPPPAAKVVSSVTLGSVPGSSFAGKLELVARAGLQSVELLDNEQARWTESELDRTRRMLRSFNLGVDLISVAPDASPLDPAQRPAFLAEVSRQLTVARRLDAPMLHLVAGQRVPALSATDQWASLVESLERAATLAVKANLTLLIEPLNGKVDHPGSFLETAAAGVRLIQQVNHDRVRLLYDLYHEHVQTGDTLASLEAAAPWVKVFHVADAPGRRAPGTGAMKLDAVYKAIRKLNFEGPVAMEYKPAAPDASAILIRAVEAMRASMAGAA